MYRMKSESPVANNDSKTHMHLFLSCSSCTSFLKNLLCHEFAIAKKHSTNEKRFCIVKLCGKLRCASPEDAHLCAGRFQHTAEADFSPKSLPISDNPTQSMENSAYIRNPDEQ